jgi:hypothetical protein
MTKAQNAAGKNFPKIFDMSPAIESWLGGSDASPTWAKSPVKMLKKNTPGDVVNSDNKIVNVSETKSSGQRASLALQVVPEWNVKDDGKLESNPMLSMPCLLELS